MTEAIKNRLEQIWAGKVPIGYYTSGGYVIPSDWKLVPLQNCFSRLTRKNEENNENVLTISAQQGLVNQMEYYNNSYASEDKRGYSLLYKGDYSYNKSYSSDYPYGAIKRLEKYDKGVVSPLYICFKPKKSTNSDFYIQYFEAGIFNREIYKIAQEGARNHGLLNVAVDDFFVSSILYPPIPEQKKIAEILMQCDKVITLKKERIEEEKKRKKWLFETLLLSKRYQNKSGEKKSNWRTIKLKEVCKIFNGDRSNNYPTASELVSNGIPFINAGHLNNHKIDFSCMNYITKEKYESMGGAKLRHGDILLCLRGSLGKYAKVDFDNGALASSMAVLRPDTKLILGEYLYQILGSSIFEKMIRTENNGSSQPNLSAQSVLQTPIELPCISEQAIITQKLSLQDQLISMLENEADQWQQEKKALMQLLLTGIVRVKK